MNQIFNFTSILKVHLDVILLLLYTVNILLGKNLVCDYDDNYQGVF